MNNQMLGLCLLSVLMCNPTLLFADDLILGGAQRLPLVIADSVPTQSPERKIPLFIHRMPSTPVAVASQNQRFIFADETLLPPDASVEKEFEWLRNAGAVAIVQDDMTESSVKAARNTGLKLILLPNLTPLKMFSYGESMDDPESVARYFVKMIRETERNADVLYHQDGRPVMWLFEAFRKPAEFYQAVRRKVRELGCDPVIYYQALLGGNHRTSADAEKYLRVFDGALIWTESYAANAQIVEMIASARGKIEKETGARRQVILTAKPGHWRPEKGSFIDPHGTRDFRQIIDLAYRFELDGLNIESWNDFGEMHHVEPSVLKSTVLSDLCTYYGKLGTGRPSTVEYPGLYVSHRRDIMAGEYLECEVLYLPVQEGGIRTIRLIMRTLDGREVFASDPWSAAANEAGAKTFNVPTRALSVPEAVFPALEINGKVQPTETFCEINASRMPFPFTMSVSMAKSLHPEEVRFRMDGHDAGSSYASTKTLHAEIAVRSDRKMSRIEIVKNDRTVYSAGFDRFMRARSPSNSYRIAGFYWDLPAPVEALKNAPLHGMDFAGSITLRGGVAIYAIQAKTAIPVLKSSSFIEWGNRKQPDDRDGIEVAFEGDEDTVFDIDIPGQSARFQVRWGDIQGAGWKEYPLLSHSRLVAKPMSGPMGHPVGLGTTSYSGSVDIPQLEELPNSILNDRNRSCYVLRIISEDNSIYRSAPIHVAAGSGDRMVRTYAWDRDREERYEIMAPENSLKDIAWTFKEGGSRILDGNRVGYALGLGGLYERDGRFDPGQIPALVKDDDGSALKFDGNDIAMTRPQLIPTGSWMLDMWIKPARVGSDKEQFIFDVPETVSIVLQPNGILRAVFGDSPASILRLTGKTVLKDGCWYRISFIYDLNGVRLMLDGNPEAAAPVKGFRHRITQRANIGATLLSGKHMSPAERGFYGLIKDITITADADRMDALSLPKGKEDR